MIYLWKKDNVISYFIEECNFFNKFNHLTDLQYYKIEPWRLKNSRYKKSLNLRIMSSALITKNIH